MTRASTTLFAALLLALAACARETDAWLADVEAPEAFPRTLAALALGEAPAADHRAAVEALLPLRADEPAVRQPALRSLRTLAGRSPELFVALLRDPAHEADRACLLDALVGAGEEVVPALLAALGNSPAGEGSELAIALGRLDQMSHPALVRWVEQGSVDQLAVAVAGVEAGQRGRAASHLAGLIVERLGGDAAQRARVLNALEQVARDSKLGAMGALAAARTRPPGERRAISRALYAGLLEGLRRGWHDRTHGHLFVEAVGPQLIPELIATLEADDERSIQQWACDALAKQGRPALKALLASDVPDGWLDEVVLAMGTPAGPWLQDAQRNENAEIRERAAQAADRLAGR